MLTARYRNKNNVISHSVEYGLVITLRADDAEILYQIQRYFDAGTISQRKRDPKRPSHNPKTTYRLGGKQSGQILVPFFDTYPLRAKKKNDFLIWKEAVKLHQQFVSRRGALEVNAPVYQEIVKLQNKLEQGRKYVEH